jgi:hypothetical protein
MTVVIKIRKGTSAQWASSTLVLAVAELGLDTTLNKLKVGNGVSTWSNLPYINVLPSEISELSQDAVNSAISVSGGITKNYDDVNNNISLGIDTSVIATITALTNHELDTTNIHGISDTAQLATKIYADNTASTQIANHEQDTTNIHGIADTSQLATKTYADNAATTAVAAVIDSAPSALNTLNELAAALNDDASYASTITTALGTKLDSTTAASTYAPIASPTFTGTVSGITKGMVGLGNVNDTSDIDKPISTLTQAAINSLSDIVNTKADKLSSSITISTSTYTIQSLDLYKRLEFTSGSAVTVTIPKDSSLNLPIGASVEILQAGAGKITIAVEDAVNQVIYGPDNQFKSRVQWSSIFIEKRAANSWLITGDTEA